MFDDPFFIPYILGAIISPLIIIGLLIYGITAWRRRVSEHAQDEEQDPGIGTVRRLYFYVVAFVSLMMSASGGALLLQFVIDIIFGGDVISDSTARLAGGVSLLIVGAPLWYFHWRYIQRAVVEQPVETRSALRKFYIYITLGIAGIIGIYTGYGLLDWAFRTGDSSGYDLAALIVWSAVWIFHWLVEEREGQPTPDAIAIRRLYTYIASLVGLAMLSFGVGGILYFILLEGYDALTAAPVISSETGLWRPALREMLAIAIVGAATWAMHWLYIARRDYDSVLRQVYLYIFAILGGVMTTLSALGIIIHEFLTWAFGAYSADTVAQHFEFLPGSVAALAIGAALWAYHWHRVRHEAGMSGGTTLSARRAYTYILTAIGTGALAIAIFMLVNGALNLILASFGDVVVGDDQWKRPLINIITLAVLGGPVWGYYWQNIQRRERDIGADERQATSRRIFLFTALGIGVLALLGSVSALIFFFLRDLLDFSLSLGTVNDMAEPIAIIVAAAAFVPYYWAVYRDDQDAAPETETDLVPEAAEEQSPRKHVALLSPVGADALVRQIQDAIDYDIDTLPWADSDAITPTLTDEECTQLARSIADAPGSYVLLIPDAGAVRVLSYDQRHTS